MKDIYIQIYTYIHTYIHMYIHKLFLFELLTNDVQAVKWLRCFDKHEHVPQKNQKIIKRRNDNA